jgi:hypothetical protein
MLEVRILGLPKPEL